MATEILCKVFFKSGPIECEAHIFASLDEAIANERDAYEFDYVLEVERDAETRIVSSRDISEDFETRWIAIERERLTDKYWTECLKAQGYDLDRYLDNNAEGPVFRKPSVRKSALIAAE